MRGFPLTRFERAFLGALGALMVVSVGLRWHFHNQSPFSIVSSPESAGAASAAIASKVDGDAQPTEAGLLAFINEAPESALTQLPGVGPVLAGRIAAFREQRGPFLVVDDLALVDGIGPARLQAIVASDEVWSFTRGASESPSP